MSDSPSPTVAVGSESWGRLGQLIDERRAEALITFLEALPPEETAYTISHLDADHRSRMFNILAEADADLAADLMEHFADAHAAEMIEEMPARTAAAIVDEMDSDEQADVLADVAEPFAEAILEQMDPAEARDVRDLLRYDEDSAGGLMITEYLVYPADMDVQEVRRDLQAHSEDYDGYEVRYLYAVNGAGHLIGTVRMRGLVMAQPGQPLSRAAILDPVSVQVDTPLDGLDDLFDRIDFNALPVLDDTGKLVGVVQQAAVQEARKEEAEEDVAKFGGIIGGEELRSMPLLSRSIRRIAFLLPIMGLLLISASIIALFEDTIRHVPIIAAFLPVIAGLCGSGGGQAVAVSMREITLGLIKPDDLFKVLAQEARVALINGVLLGVVMFGVVFFWQGNAYLAGALGITIPVVMLLAKCIGGTVPLLLRALGVDPAMASMPAVTTAVDLFGFLVVLLLTTLVMGHIVPGGS